MLLWLSYGFLLPPLMWPTPIFLFLFMRPPLLRFLFFFYFLFFFLSSLLASSHYYHNCFPLILNPWLPTLLPSLPSYQSTLSSFIPPIYIRPSIQLPWAPPFFPFHDLIMWSIIGTGVRVARLRDYLSICWHLPDFCSYDLEPTSRPRLSGTVPLLSSLSVCPEDFVPSICGSVLFPHSAYSLPLIFFFIYFSMEESGCF